MNGRKIHLCFAGNMLGQNAGFITTQGQIVSNLFAGAGYEVTCVSSKINRIARLSEIVAALIKNKHGFDVVILEVYSGLNILMAETVGFLCKLLKLPLIMVLHGGKLPEFVEKNPRLTKRVLRRADILVAPSQFLAEKIGAGGFDIRVIPNVIDIDFYPFRERKKISPRLIWMRSFHPIYNPQMAVKVLAEVRRTFPDATLTMAGKDKGIEREIKKTASDFGLNDAIHFAGFLDEKKKIEKFSEADIYINTNHFDNMPVSVIEACAMGLPVVATNVGGLPYLISHGENGLLVADGDERGMAQEIKCLLENPELAQKISRNGRALADRSSWKNVRQEWESLFASVLDKKSGKNIKHLFKSEFAKEKFEV